MLCIAHFALLQNAIPVRYLKSFCIGWCCSPLQTIIISPLSALLMLVQQSVRHAEACLLDRSASPLRHAEQLHCNSSYSFVWCSLVCRMLDQNVTAHQLVCPEWMASASDSVLQRHTLQHACLCPSGLALDQIRSYHISTACPLCGLRAAGQPGHWSLPGPDVHFGGELCLFSVSP